MKARGAPRPKISAQRKQVKHLMRDKNLYLDEKTAAIEKSNEMGHTRDMYRLIWTHDGSKKNTTETVKSATGECITDTNKVMTRWAEHFSQLLNSDETPKPINQAYTPPKIMEATPQEALTKRETAEAIRGLQKRRAGGCDQISPELYIEGGDALTDMVKSLLDSV